VIGTLDDAQLGARQPLHDRPKQRKVGELVSRSLQEQQGDGDSRQVLRAYDRRLARRM
jgi:hypothetical protein